MTNHTKPIFSFKLFQLKRFYWPTISVFIYPIIRTGIKSIVMSARNTEPPVKASEKEPLIQKDAAIIPITLPNNEDAERPINPAEMYISFFKNNLPLMGVVLFTVVISYLVGKWHYSVLWLVLVAYAAWEVGKRRVEQFEAYHTNRVERTLAKQRLPTSPETCEWINHIIERFWGVFEPVMSAQIIDQVNAILSQSKPAFLDSIELSEFTLGSSAPAILGAQVYPHITDADNIHLDLEMSFVPSDSILPEAYLPPNRRGFVWNSKIVLTTRIGRGLVGVDIPVMIQEIMFHGKIRCHITLAPNLPFVKTVQICFLQDPDIDFILKPLKAMDLMDLPGLRNWLNSTIRTNVHALLVNPNKITIDVMELMAAKKKMESEGHSIGVAKITVYQVRGLKNPSGATVRMSVAGKFKATTDRLKEDTTSWNEVFYVMISTINYPITFNIQGPSSMLMSASAEALGSCKISLDDPDDLKNTGWRTLTVRGQAKGGRAEVKVGVEYFSTLESTEEQIANTMSAEGGSSSAQADIVNKKITKSPCGVLHLIVHSAKELSGKKPWSPFVEIEVDSALAGEADRKKLDPEYNFYRRRTVTKKKTSTPNWEQNFEFLLGNINTDEIRIRVRDSKEDVELGHISGSIAEFVKMGTNWLPLEGVESGRIYLSFLYNPVAIPGGISASGEMIYVPAIGVARVTVQKAQGIDDKLVKQDYYATVSSNDALIGKTRKAKADKGVDGEIMWQETFDVLVKTMEDDIVVGLYDENNMTKDDLVGSGKLILPVPYVATPSLFELPKGRKLSVSTLYMPIAQPQEGQEPLKPGSLMLNTGIKGNCGILKIDSVVMEGVGSKSMLSSSEKRIKLLPEIYVTAENIVRLSAGKSRDGTFRWKDKIELFIADTAKDQIHILFIEEKEFGNDCLVSLRVPVSQLKLKAWYPLYDEEGKVRERGRIYFEGCFRPIPTTLPPRPDDNGVLKIDLRSASNLLAVDSGGSSDPYVQILLNDKKINKTKVIKKNNLAPVWNESFELPITSRRTAQLELQVRDWNQIQVSKLLGTARLDLINLKDDEVLSHDAYKLQQAEKGTLSFTAIFKPSSMQNLDKIGPAFVKEAKNLIAVPGKAIGSAVTGAAGATGKALGSTGKAIGSTGKAIGGAVGSTGKAIGGVFGIKKKEESVESNTASAPKYGLQINVLGLAPSAFLAQAVDAYDVQLRASSQDDSKLWKSKALKRTKSPLLNESFDVHPKSLKNTKFIEFPLETSLTLEQLALPAGTKPMFRLDLNRPEMATEEKIILSLPLNDISEDPSLLLNVEVTKDYNMSASKGFFGSKK